jgi:hypothetical protein
MLVFESKEEEAVNGRGVCATSRPFLLQSFQRAAADSRRWLLTNSKDFSMTDYAYRRDLLGRIAIIGLVFGLTLALPNPITCSPSDFTFPHNHADGPEKSGQ